MKPKSRQCIIKNLLLDLSVIHNTFGAQVRLW